MIIGVGVLWDSLGGISGEVLWNRCVGERLWYKFRFESCAIFIVGLNK